MKDKPYEERLKFFQDSLVKLCTEADVQLIPALSHAPGAIVAEIRIIDMQNDELMKKYGIVRINKKNADEAPAEEPPENPRLN